MRVRLDIPELVWNSYGWEVDTELLAEEFDDRGLQDILKNDFDNNPWKLADATNAVKYPELNEACYEFIDTDFDKLELDY